MQCELEAQGSMETGLPVTAWWTGKRPDSARALRAGLPQQALVMVGCNPRFWIGPRALHFFTPLPVIARCLKAHQDGQ